MKEKIFRLIIAFGLLWVCGHSQAKESKRITIKGQVIDYMAKPVEGAEVVVYEEVIHNGEDVAKVMTSIVKTDREGRFDIWEEISSRLYTHIVARKPGLAMAWDRVNRYGITKGKGRVVLVLDRPGLLSGVVVDHNGRPVLGADVQAVPKTSYLRRLEQDPIIGPNSWFSTQTDSQGMFRFSSFSHDVSSDFWINTPSLNCIYTFTTHWTTSCGFEVGRPNIRLVLPRECKIQGRVIEKETGKPVGGVELVIRPHRDREVVVCRYRACTTVSDEKGMFIFPGLPEGRHRIELAIQEQQKCRWAVKSMIIDIQADSPNDNIRVTVEKSGIIELSVHEEETNRPLSDFFLRARSQNNFYILGLDPSGRTRLGVLPDKYEVDFWHKEPYSSWRANGPVVVEAGKTSHLPIVVEKVPIVSGKIIAPSGEPAAGVLVTVNPRGNQVYTDNNGTFQAEGSKDGCDIVAQNFENGLVSHLHLKEDEVSKPVTLHLKPGLTVKGKITDSNGIGIPAARVIFGGQHVFPEVLTDPKGRFEIKGILPIQSSFDYRILACASGFGPRTRTRIILDVKSDGMVEIKPIQLELANTSISGTVVDANGLPAARVPIFLHGADGSDQPEKSTATDENGRFAIHRICKAPLRIQANFGNSPGGSGFLYAQGGDKDVKIILDQEGVHQPYVSLAGKPLPELESVGIKLSPADVEGKKILVCFWDVNQRPSRHCIIQLTKQAEQLQSKGITTIAVQASKIDREDLNQWVKKYNIPFPVGMIQVDEKTALFNWGVKSLPWLILTNRTHVVYAEGFSPGELDEKLEQSGDKL